MDMRRHSVDFPISKTLVALRRVRSLRDPSTNSMSKLSALVDNLNWETKSSNAIILGFDNGCNEGRSDNNVAEFRSSSLHTSNKHNASDLKLFQSSRHCDSGLLSGKSRGNLIGKIDSTMRNQINAHPLKNEMVSEEKDWSVVNGKEEVEEGFEFNSTIVSGDCTEGGGSIDGHEKRSKLTENRGHGRLKLKSCNRKHNRMSRVITGDVLSCVVSPCLSTSDTLKEGSCNGLSLCRTDDCHIMDSGHRGCGIRSCWSRTMKLRESNIRGQPGMEESPLLLENADCQHNSEGVPPYMESPRSLCQKFMPKSFKELVGQDVVTRSLLSAISSGRIASLYLFYGPRGVGKTSAARIFAAALNCISPEIDKPCGVCQDCILFFGGRSLDVKEVHSVTINSMKRFRSLLKNADSPSVYSRFKVYIIDECHLMQGETWAMMLNKLEELPRNVVFVIVTPDLDMLPCSAVSKSQKYHFQLVKEIDIVCRLEKLCADEGLEFEEDALNMIATKSNGSLRDAAMMLDHLSLLGKKITMSLVYEVNGVVSDDELLDLLQIALSSDASSTVRRARELMRSRIDPLQLISQLANLIMDILAEKCEQGNSQTRMKFLAEADPQQLSQALKLLSETEKQLRTSKNQVTWLTVALLQLGAAGSSHDDNNPRLSLQTLRPQDGEYLSTSSNRECLKHPVNGSCEDDVLGKMGIQDDMENLELIWKRAIGICESNSLKTFLQKRGKLVSVSLASGVAVAELEFDHPDYVSKAEKSWKVIAVALQNILGYNVELRINLANTASTSSKYGKLKKPYLGLLSCSRRLQPENCVECGSNASESSSYTVTTQDRCVEKCISDYPRCQTEEMISSIRSSDGNALSVGVRTPHKPLLDCMEIQNPSQADSWNDDVTNGCSYSVDIKPANQYRRSGWWKPELQQWRTVKVLLGRVLMKKEAPVLVTECLNPIQLCAKCRKKRP